MAANENHRNARDVITDYETAILTIGTTEVPLRVGGSNLDNRKQLIIINDATALIFVSDVTPFTIGLGNKITVFSGEAITIDVSDQAGKTWYAKTDEITTQIRIAEVR